jgi:hypothetical protein
MPGPAEYLHLPQQQRQHEHQHYLALQEEAYATGDSQIRIQQLNASA